MHAQKMADINNENMWNPWYVAYIRCFFQSLLLFILCHCPDCNSEQLTENVANDARRCLFSTKSFWFCT